MTTTYDASDFQAVSTRLKRHLSSLSSPIDAFLEAHILASSHYLIHNAGEEIGYASIHEGSLVTQFSLEPPYRRYGQDLFAKLTRLETVQAAFVPTCDEFFLSHVLDSYRQLNKQAYFFTAPDSLAVDLSVEEGPYRLRQAAVADTEPIVRETADFFGDQDEITQRAARGELFLTLRDDRCVGFGILEKSKLLSDAASIGMIVPERFRRQGVGTATLKLLIGECRQQGLTSVAGCWYYNHLSKKTLERAGMMTQTRLLKVDL